MNLPDLFDGCYSGEHQRQAPEQFKTMFCNACQNAGCRNSRTARSAWILRILTQEDRLLVNPQFASDGAGDGLPDFKDLLHKVLALEVSDQRGDWNPVSEAEVQNAARKLVGIPPTSFVAEKPIELPPPKIERWVVKGDHGDSYEVSLTEAGEWGCTCKGFTFTRDCKHVADLKVKLTRQPTNAVEPAGPMSRPAPFLPPAQNTRIPSTGIVIGGAPAPQEQPAAVHDPWAAPEKTLKVGGRFVLGGGKSQP
jgi:hypothetical protein